MPGDEPPIVIRPSGKMANQLFQVMLATELQQRAGGGRIVGYDLPAWDMVAPAGETLPIPHVVLEGHSFDLDHAAFLLRAGMVKAVVIGGWGMRLGYYGPAPLYRGLFQTTARGHATRDDELVIHIRGDDILDLHHPFYFPMPFSFYEQVIAATGLRPVFMGQIGADSYSRALRRRFAGAKFLAPRSAVEDFTTIRNACHVVLSVSSFAWLAAWLSETAVTVHLPVFGLFDPRNGLTFLLPLDDARYRFYAVDVPPWEKWRGVDVAAWAERTPSAGALGDRQLQDLAIAGLVRRNAAGSPTT